MSVVLPLIVTGVSTVFPAALQLPLLPDTLCLRYRFYPGDTLEYRIEAQDSILIESQAPLLRERYETLLLVCDSVGADGTFWLRFIPGAFLARERTDTLTSFRSESPCQHRIVVLQTDSFGQRLKGGSSEQAPTVCPGGVLQLPFLLPLSPRCVRIHESWLIQDSLELWENATPAPRFTRTSLLRLFPRKDTLGYRCADVHHVTTGKGWFVRDSTLSVHGIVNAFGRLLLSEEGIPVWAYITEEIRLGLWINGRLHEGLHYGNVFFRLQARRPAQKPKAP